MLSANITIRRGASQDTITVVEPTRTTVIDQSTLDRRDRNKLRRRLVALFERDRELQSQVEQL